MCTGEDMVIALANEATLKAWGKDTSVIGKTFKEALPELEGQPFSGLLLRVYTTGVPYYSPDARADIEVDGKLQTFYFKFTYQPVRNAQGRIYGVLCIATDVTEIMLARHAEEKAQKNLRNLILQAPVGICIVKGEPLYAQVANDQFLEVAGKTLKEFEEKPYWEVLKEAAAVYAPICKNVMETGISFHGKEHELMLIRNGREEIVFLDFVYEPIKNIEGIFDTIMVLVIDVTDKVVARKKAEESELRFKSFLESMVQMSWKNTPGGEVIFFNRQWYTYTGLRFDDLKDWGWKSVVHPEDLEITIDRYTAALTSKTSFEVENRYRRADGAYRWFLNRAVPIKDENDEIEMWVHTATDIEELKILQQQKDDFIGIASHELKTPVTSLKASLQLLDTLKDKMEGSVAPKLIDHANASLERVTFLIEDLLSATKLKEGHFTLKKNIFGLSSLVNQCCQQIAVSGDQQIIVEADARLMVNADIYRIEQVMYNLLGNAIKYAPQSKEIKVIVERAGLFAKVSVVDQGMGIAQQKQEHLFKRYFRVDIEGIQYSGLGLGLYISSQIIEKHHGKIGVESEPGKGSTFWFTIPVN